MSVSLPQRKRLPHDRPVWVDAGAIYFITVACLARGRNQLCEAEVAARLFETVSFRQNRGQWYVHLLVLMPDHIHALISFPVNMSMREIVAEWKESAARRAGIKWQRDFFDHRLRGNESLIEKANYVRQNPVRKGLVECSEDWPYVWVPGERNPCEDGGTRLSRPTGTSSEDARRDVLAVGPDCQSGRENGRAHRGRTDGCGETGCVALPPKVGPDCQSGRETAEALEEINP